MDDRSLQQLLLLSLPPSLPPSLTPHLVQQQQCVSDASYLQPLLAGGGAGSVSDLEGEENLKEGGREGGRE